MDLRRPRVYRRCNVGLVSNWQFVSIDSGKDLATNRRKAITWTDVNDILWGHMASLGHNDLTVIAKMA